MARSELSCLVVQEVATHRDYAAVAGPEPCDRLAAIRRTALLARHRLLQTFQPPLIPADARGQLDGGASARHDACLHAEVQSNPSRGRRCANLDLALGL